MLKYLLALCVALFTAASAADELLIFTLPGCRPCAYLKKMLEENPAVVQDFKVSYVDVTAHPETAKLFHVNSMPTIVRLDADDREVARTVGYDGKRDFEEWLKNPNAKQPEKKRTRLLLSRR